MEKQTNGQGNGNGNNASKRLTTWLPIDVFFGLTEFAKTYAKTGLDKFDYGVALRILLMKSEYLDMMYKSHAELGNRIDELEEKIESSSDKEINKIPEGYYEVKTLSD